MDARWLASENLNVEPEEIDRIKKRLYLSNDMIELLIHAKKLAETSGSGNGDEIKIKIINLIMQHQENSEELNAEKISLVYSNIKEKKAALIFFLNQKIKRADSLKKIHEILYDSKIFAVLNIQTYTGMFSNIVNSEKTISANYIENLQKIFYEIELAVINSNCAELNPIVPQSGM